MRKVLRPLIVLVLLGAAMLLAAPAFYLHQMIRDVNFKSLTESKVRELLQADVKIHKINVGQINEVDLSGLEISPVKDVLVPYQVKVDKIIFRYDPFQMITGAVAGPHSVILKSPEVLLSDSKFPYEFFKNLQRGSSQTRLSTLEFRGGMIKVMLRQFQSELVLGNIRGFFTATPDGAVRVRFSADASGFLRGAVKVSGAIYPDKPSHDLKLEMADAAIEKGLALPLEGFQGNVRWQNDNFYFENLKTQIRGWESSVSGSAERMSASPRFVIMTVIGRKEFSVQIPFEMDTDNRKMRLEIIPSEGSSHDITGDIETDGLLVRLPKLTMDKIYHGQGNIDFSGGDFRIDLTHEKQRLGVLGNLKKADLDLDVKFDHGQFYEMDVVGGASLHLTPMPFMGEDRYWRFKADFQSSYFILQYIPFENFKGSFEIDKSGIQNLTSTWGTAFAMSGNYSFEKPETSLLAIKVSDLDLSGVKNFGSKPLPSRLDGIMSGRIKIEGEMEKPAVSGSLAIKDGALSRLDFDRAMIEFSGRPPKLELGDSKIIKGRTKLNLVGSIDLSSSNILSPIEIQTAEKFVIWKGIQLSAETKPEGFEISTPMGKKLPPLAVEAGYKSGDYSDGKDKNFQDEGYIATGPKIKF